jgi:hypothetical protein
MPINGEFGKILKKRRLLECHGKTIEKQGLCLVGLSNPKGVITMAI